MKNGDRQGFGRLQPTLIRQQKATVLLQKDCRSCYHMWSIHISCITICRYHCTNVSSAFLMSPCPFCLLQQSESLRKQHTSPSSSSTSLGSRGHHLPQLLSAVFVRVFFLPSNANIDVYEATCEYSALQRAFTAR